ncbi:probable serine/threonine-protein kinase samkC [Echeneis naucrates]|uniref:probable serine/threonine-protein kinase samkC n=1 Tax=Echeneis naucrates TaxID=173247 RepID=UPI0011141816|nr:probable serine/threonine-protein kinase samkC [Echeneis naucrates]
MSDCGGVPEDGPEIPTSRSGPDFCDMSRCAGCCNQKVGSMPQRGDDGESSSSAEDSGSETDCDSESSSTSSCSVPFAEENSERAETGSRGWRDENSEREQNRSKTKGRIGRASLVKSFSLPPSLIPRLIPLSLLPSPPRIVSTLHLEVLPEKHSDTFTIRRQSSVSERGTSGVEGVSANSPPPQQPSQCQPMGIPLQDRSKPTLQQFQCQEQQQQKQMMYQYQHQSQHCPPLSTQGQGTAMPPNALFMPHPQTPLTYPQAPNAQAHLYALTPTPCWYCYCMHLPYTCWSHYTGGEF